MGGKLKAKGSELECGAADYVPCAHPALEPGSARCVLLSGRSRCVTLGCVLEIGGGRRSGMPGRGVSPMQAALGFARSLPAALPGVVRRTRAGDGFGAVRATDRWIASLVQRIEWQAVGLDELPYLFPRPVGQRGNF